MDLFLCKYNPVERLKIVKMGHLSENKNWLGIGGFALQNTLAFSMIV